MPAIRAVAPRHLILAGILVVAAVLRIAGLAWGLPTMLHPDEWVIVEGALDLDRRNSFEPSMFYRPDHVEIQLSFLAYTAYAKIVFQTTVEAAYAIDPGAFLLISRAITAVFGMATVVLAFLIARRFSLAAGLVAAALFAIHPALVEHAHYATPDIPATAAFMGAMLALLHYLDRPRIAPLLVASACTSIAIAIKYPGAIATVLIAAVVVAAAVRDRRFLRILGHGAIGVVAVIGFLFLISPVLFTNAGAVVRALLYESTDFHSATESLGVLGNLGFYAAWFAGSAGVILVCAFLVGAVVAVRTRALDALVLGFGALNWVVLSLLALHWERWGVPMLLTPLLLAAIGLVAIARWLRRRLARAAVARALVIAGAVVVGLTLLVPSLAVVLRHASPDPRISSDAALAGIDVTPETTAYEGYTPFMPSQPWSILGQLEQVGGEWVPTDPARDRIMVSSCMSDRYLEQERFAQEREVYESLGRDHDVLLRVDAVEPSSGALLEPLTIAGALGEIGALLAGGQGGCSITVYDVGP